MQHNSRIFSKENSNVNSKLPVQSKCRQRPIFSSNLTVFLVVVAELRSTKMRNLELVEVEVFGHVDAEDTLVPT